MRNDFFGNNFIFVVEYRPNGQYLECNCKLFESSRIICCQVMKVLTYKNINFLNERYIKRRWRKDVNRPQLSKIFKEGYPKMSEEYQQYKEFLRIFDEVFDSGTMLKKMTYIKSKLVDLKNEMMEWDDTFCGSRGFPFQNNIFPYSYQDNTTAENEVREDHLQNPHIAKSRGRPRLNRIRSALESRHRGRSGGRGGGR